MDLEKANKEKLRSVFPECFSENKLDIDKLLSLCGEYIDNDFEKYKFEWHGKAESLRLAQKRSTGTLRPCPEESVNFDDTQNLYIEGDNLEVLKLLQTAYYRRVKMIYIDPPYNTGNDFVYEDDFADPMARYREVTQQTTKSNPETMGRYHTNWLNMMYPRLRLAANLLRDDGVIFISIDEHEIHNLRKLCDEVFGEENYIGLIVWKNATDNNPTQIAIEHEYMICYAKSRLNTQAVWKSKVTEVKDILVEIGEKLAKEYHDQDSLQAAYDIWFKENKWQLWPLDRYKYIDKDGVYTGSQSVHNPGRGGYRYDIIHPVTGQPCKQPLMGYRFPESTMKEMLESGKVLFGSDHNKIVELKVYAKDYEEKLSSIFELDGRLGSYDLKSLFGENPIFSNPKPVQLVKRLLSFIVDDTDIVLDFFSGSATTAVAIMELNAADHKERKYICVQLPENLDSNYETADAKAKSIIKNAIELLDEINKPHAITEIGKERIRRAGAQIMHNSQCIMHNSQCIMHNSQCIIHNDKRSQDVQCTIHNEEDTQIMLEDNNCELSIMNYELDTGFRVFKLDTSNLKLWDGTPVDEEDYQIMLDRMNDSINSIKEDRTDMDVVYEIMLKMGVPLTYPVLPLELDGVKAYSVGEDGLLMVCLDAGITTETIEQLAEYAPAKIVVAESCFADVSAMRNAHYVLKDRKIELKLI